MDGDPELRTLRRGLAALALVNQSEAVSIARAAAVLQLPRTTAERILNALVTDGYVERSALDKQYRATAKVLALSSGFSGDNWITRLAAPLLSHTTEEIGWPLAIAVPEGADMRVRYTTDGMTTLWLNRRRVGSSIPIPKASSGTVVLAFTSPAEGTELRAAIAQRYPEMALAEDQIRQARLDGYAFSPQDTREQSISLPILLEGKLAAVLLMVFMSRVHNRAAVIEKYLPRLRALTTDIAGQAGATPDNRQPVDRSQQSPSAHPMSHS